MTRGFGARGATVVFLLCAALVAADRWSWAKAARCGEDQAVALRLAESLPWHPPALERTTGRSNACERRCPGGTGRYDVGLADEPTAKGSREVWRGPGLRVWWVEP